MATQHRTPGVYISEPNSFPPSIVGVGTAIPAFIGYTEKGYAAPKTDGTPGLPIPVKISSMVEYAATFGGPYVEEFYLSAAAPPAGDRTIGTLVLGTTSYQVVETPAAQFNLYNSLLMFFANGGSDCWIVSCGPYATGGTPTPIAKGDFLRGLDAIKDVVGPTMLVIPDAMLLADAGSFGDVCVQMLDQCLAQQDRVAVLDVWVDPQLERDPASNFDATVTAFRDDLAAAPQQSRRYGMAYFPNIMTSMVDPNDVTVANFATGHRDDIVTALKKYNDELYAADPANHAIVAALLDDVQSGNWTGSPTAKTDPKPMTAAELTAALVGAMPPIGTLQALIAASQNLMPPSGAMAGIYAMNDANIGVWNAPANVGIAGAVAPVFNITDAQQADLNMPINGLAVNAIRTFVGRGTLVWGARTLDGNSNDWRYIQVRRTMIYVEQSIKQALNQMVFAPNTAQTWVTTTAMVESFLHGLWAAGGLMGASPEQAYTVACGLGSTMTPDDVLNGIMRVSVVLTMVHPAEFIELTFVQQMMGGS